MPGAQDPPQATPRITLHAPYTTTPSTKTPPSSTTTTSQPPPSVAFLAGTWHVTHSTLPMWSSKRDVTITYTPLEGSAPTKLDDLVEYAPANRPADSTKARSSVHGVDTLAQLPHGGGWAWDWRGKGWLKMASSRWEVLGYGDDREVEAGQDDREANNQWVVTFFASTLFTPAGIDIYSRGAGGLRPETVADIKSALQRLGDGGGVANLAGKLFEVPR